MIDWHSHILPEMDDGSRSLDESINLINMQVEQGVNTVIATPHFYANDESVESFLRRRSIAFEKLKKVSSESFPEIILGAEVKYYPGISKMTDLKRLRIENSKLLLLEMPLTKWTEYVIRELIELSRISGIKIILAHIDRYLSLQKQEVWERLFESGILMQVNASFSLSLVSKHRVISMLKNGYIHFLGSDCHNLNSRPPKIGKAYDLVRKKCGDDFISRMNEFGYSMLTNKNN